MVNGKLTPFQEMRRLYSVPRSFEFRYWQLRPIIGAQFPEPVVLESDSIERLLTSGLMGNPLSTLYLYLTMAYDTKRTRSLDKWRAEVPALSKEVWEDCFLLLFIL